MGNTKNSFNIHVEALNTKPETRVTIQSKWHFKKTWLGGVDKESFSNVVNSFLSELQKVLSTY